MSIDKYTPLDVINGTLMGFRGLTFQNAVIGAVAFEVLSRLLLDPPDGRKHDFEQSATNILASLAGWATVRALRST